MYWLLDWFPLILFYSVYHAFGLFKATWAVMGWVSLHAGSYLVRQRPIPKTLQLTAGMAIALGSATLLLHDALYIKLKPSAVYLCLAGILWAPYAMRRHNILKPLLGDTLKLSDWHWNSILHATGLYLTTMAGLNLWVALYCTTSTWVSFKLFGTLGGTVALMLGLALYLQCTQAPDIQPSNGP